MEWEYPVGTSITTASSWVSLGSIPCWRKDIIITGKTGVELEYCVRTSITLQVRMGRIPTWDQCKIISGRAGMEFKYPVGTSITSQIRMGKIPTWDQCIISGRAPVDLDYLFGTSTARLWAYPLRPA